MNKTSERYNTKVEIPITVILETIFTDDNHDVETLCRWAKEYGFVDFDNKCYKLQNDYNKQSFYRLLDKEERKQYDYENYLCEENDKLQQENQELKDRNNKVLDEIVKDKMEQFDDYVIYLLEKYENILKEDNKEEE